MSDIITKGNRDTYLRTQNRYYVAGWVDGENDAKSQVSWDICATGEAEKSYLDGYVSAKDNQFTQDGSVSFS